MTYSLTVPNRLNGQSLIQNTLGGARVPVADALRSALGRFMKGCRPGPGRPRKFAPRSYVPPLDLYQRVVDMDHSVTAWKSIVDRLGPPGARAFLDDLEAEKGKISFRHLVLKAIAEAEKEALKPKKLTKRNARKRAV